MTSVLIFAFFACEESTPDLPGESNTLNFSTTTKNMYGEYWNLEKPVATHTVLNLHVKNWIIQSKEFEDPDEKKAAYAPFLERYGVQDFQKVHAKMERENFVFVTPLQVISTESTQASEEHLGSIDVISSKEGTFSIMAATTGADVDTVQVEFAAPAYWGLGAAAQGFWGENIKRPHHRKVCIYGTGTVKFLYGLYDSQDRNLFGTVPQIQFSVEHESVEHYHQDGVLSIEIKEGFDQAQLKLEPRNVFGEALYEALPPVELCSADDSFVTGISTSAWTSEEMSTEFQELSDSDLQAAAEGLKLTKRRSPQRRFLKQVVKNKGHAVTGFMPELTTTVPTFNVPVTVAPVGGMVAKIEDIMQSSDTMALFVKHSQPSLTVPSGTPLIISFPHNKEHVVSLSSAGHQKDMVIPHSQPSKP